jgi:hypothetical protein
VDRAQPVDKATHRHDGLIGGNEIGPERIAAIGPDTPRRIDAQGG